MMHDSIDLSMLFEGTLDIKINSQLTIKVNKPTRLINLALIEIEEISRSKSSKKNLRLATEKIYNVTRLIFNNNTESKKWDDLVEKIPLDYCQQIIEKYMNWATELEQNPN